jgi:hypothetical protein
MNTKIIVALVIGIALIVLTGAASASLYDDYMARSSGNINTHTDITGTCFTSESSLSVSGMPTEEHYKQYFVADFFNPIFPPADLCYNDIDICGDSFTRYNKIESAPTGSSVSTKIDSPDDVSGTWEHWDCAMWGRGEGPQVKILPQPRSEPSGYVWSSDHLAGATYPGRSIENQSIYWP